MLHALTFAKAEQESTPSPKKRNVLNTSCALHLWELCWNHHVQVLEYEMRLGTQDEIGLDAHFHKTWHSMLPLLPYRVDHGLRKHKSRAFAPLPGRCKHRVTEEVPEVNMEQLTGLRHHDIIIVSIPEAEDAG